MTNKFKAAFLVATLIGLSAPVAANSELVPAVNAYRAGNYESARLQLLPFAEQGNPQAQYFIAAFYDHGFGVAIDDSLAVEWYSRAANQGFDKAQFALGSIYENGEGVEKNMATAATWFALAADQGHADAQRMLGMLFLKGNGVDQSDVLARKWMTLAAEKGHPTAQYNLSIMYHRGDAVPQSDRHSYMWAKISLANGNVGGLKHLKRIEKSMTALEIASAEKLVAMCLSKEFKDC